MKRHRFLKFSIDATRNLFTDDTSGPLIEKYKEEQRGYMEKKYGSLDFEKKFKRWLSVPKPVLSVVDEHTYLIQDIEDAYVNGNLYSALTGSCCLGERIFNHILTRVRYGYKSSPYYKKIYNKDSINDWELGIEILKSWGIIQARMEEDYRRLYKLRTESVHFQSKEQDLELMSKEAISLINQITSDLFELRKDKDFLIWFEVPGEIYLRKEAEEIPFIKAFYVPCAPLVGYKHTIELTPGHTLKVVDNEVYENKEIPDAEFVELRNKYTNKK